VVSEDAPPFSQWALGQDFFSRTQDPWERTKGLLTEIQKRSLAEQVLLLSWDTRNQTCKLLSISPPNDKPVLGKTFQEQLIRKAYDENCVLNWEDFWDDPVIQPHLKQSRYDTLLVSPVSLEEPFFDVLILINYSCWGEPNRINEFIMFVSSVLSLSMQNFRLYLKLKQKNIQLRDWTSHVEERIERGTREILEKEFQYYSLFEGTNDGIVVHDQTGSIIEANRVACRMLGFEKKDLTQKKWDELVPSTNLEKQKAFFRKVLERVQSDPLVTRLRKGGGAIFDAELNSRCVRFRGKQRIQTFIRDISFQQKLQQSLRESKEKYRLLVESSLVGVFILKQNVIQFGNSCFQRMTGYTSEELLDRDFAALIAPEHRQKVIEKESEREHGKAVSDHYEVTMIRKGGKRFWGDLRMRRIVLDQQPAVLGNIIDISQRRKLEQQLFDAQKLESIGTLAGGIAHDFNNMLGGILGYASLILTDMPRENPYYSDIHTIAETAKRAAELTNRLLAFAQRGKYRENTLNMNRLVRQVVDHATSVKESRIEITFDRGRDLWPVRGDSKQIYQALLNIVMNGMEAIQEKGRLIIETCNIHLKDEYEAAHVGLLQGDYVHISVQDSGTGMDEKTQSRIFEPFFTTKTHREGAGLGLAMVYGIVKNHDGNVWVESTPEQGSRFHVYLPRYIELPEIRGEPSEPVRQAHNMILLVDDEKVIREVGLRMLEKGGFRVVMARNGKEALDIYKENQSEIDLVLLDLIMPVMGGKETYRRLKEINPAVRVGFTSGYIPSVRPELISMGKAFFVQKPFQTEYLIEKVKNMLKNSSDS
jgi:PAS domain S-box-containing protein